MIFKIFFTWWNKQTFGTFLKTLFFGKFVGSDEFGNKYYKSKKTLQNRRDFHFLCFPGPPQKPNQTRLGPKAPGGLICIDFRFFPSICMYSH